MDVLERLRVQPLHEIKALLSSKSVEKYALIQWIPEKQPPPPLIYSLLHLRT